jgi:hypothetical protein
MCLAGVVGSARNHRLPAANNRFTRDDLGGVFPDCPGGMAWPVDAFFASIEACASGDSPTAAPGAFLIDGSVFPASLLAGASASGSNGADISQVYPHPLFRSAHGKRLANFTQSSRCLHQERRVPLFGSEGDQRSGAAVPWSAARAKRGREIARAPPTSRFTRGASAVRSQKPSSVPQSHGGARR